MHSLIITSIRMVMFDWFRYQLQMVDIVRCYSLRCHQNWGMYIQATQPSPIVCLYVFRYNVSTTPDEVSKISRYVRSFFVWGCVFTRSVSIPCKRPLRSGSHCPGQRCCRLVLPVLPVPLVTSDHLRTCCSPGQ